MGFGKIYAQVACATIEGPFIFVIRLRELGVWFFHDY